MFEEYDGGLLDNMRSLYNSLSEKDRRRYAAIEARKLGHGGILNIATLFGCDEKTVRKGIVELNDKACMEQDTIRREGGGRMSKLEKYDDPMDEKVKWTNLTRNEICKRMAKKGIKISKNIAKKLLKKHGYVKRKALKKKSTGENKNRDQQFKKISILKKEYEDSDNPIISVDAKKKNLLGTCIEMDVLNAQRQ